MKLLPEGLQEPPEWWWHLSKTQRNLIRYGSMGLSLLLLALSILGVLYSVNHSSGDGSKLSSSSRSSAAGAAARYQPQHMPPSSSPMCSWDSLYLPRTVQPSNYKLHIMTNMQEPYLVEGEVQIALKATEATPCIVLHATGIDVQSVKLLVSTEGADAEGQQPVEVQGEAHSIIGGLSACSAPQ